ncbi:zinc ABC transporter substrate-binding protein [Ectothiorhodospira shaposhnikovii]|uniref:zinc ABC transporter substrate-binding protein ZnuA n=1 Tax=Ectothiorhodospira shaposhnikovii TaxID=1054 RepID=UPI0019031AB7|nr:zinc ABC transporter substrate-binding protein ZnuA [Ectothiorhodospira shaposhnikovii]MBK1673384.1 zinc ABC transporter substrate-binding protein [Ectothiorhodospira shaposhnikovii]
MRSKRLLAGVAALVLTLPLSLQAAPRVVVSIPPIHNLVSGVMEGVSEPVLLVPGGASPHDYALRPSDMRHLQSAQVVIWVGRDMESFLTRPLSRLPDSVRTVTLLKEADLVRHELREGGIWDRHDHDHGHSHSHDHDHSHSHDHAHDHHHHDIDSHVWLSPENAARIVRHVAAVLTEQDPDNGVRYRENRDRILAQLSELDTRLQTRLAPIQGRPFIVFHDAYQYFEKHYGLTPAGSVTIDPSRPAGARRIQALRQRIQDSDAICVFSEPQFKPAIVDTLVEGTGARTGILDPLGADLPTGVESYYRLLENLGDSLVGCLEN